MTATILDEIKTLVRRFGPKDAKLEASTELAADLSIDSVAAMDLVMEIEDHYDIDLPINQIADLKTVGDLAELVERQLEKKG